MGLSSYHWDWATVFTPKSIEMFIHGIEVTAEVSLASLVIGLVLGLVTAVPRAARVPVVSQFVYVYVDFFRTTPVLVQLIWMFYVLPVLLGINLSPFVAGVLTIGLNCGAFLSEIFRAGLLSIGRGQREAAQVLGLGRMQALIFVIVPQATRRVFPAVINIFISVVKDSSLVSIIAVADLTYLTQGAVSLTYRPFEFYTMLGILYFLMTYPFSLLSSFVERRFHVA